MSAAVAAVISAAVEGITDEAVVRKLITHVGAEPGTVYGKKGKPHLRSQIDGYNNAARHAPWVVLVDLDHTKGCAPTLCAEWLAEPAPQLCFRVAVRAVEAWLMADAEALADFLGVGRKKVPVDPETLANPKQALVNLASQSRKREIREDMVPRQGSGRTVGPAYASRLIEFVYAHWRPAKAADRADSLRRTITCLKRLATPA